MNSSVLRPIEHEPESHLSQAWESERNLVLQELDRILASRYFKSAGRSRQFLQFVVLNKLEGKTEQLKERTIGTEIFHRPPGYATGEDPVVRVQAGEVRRRLEQYYQGAPQPVLLRIELPIGSYSPVFHRGPLPEVHKSKDHPESLIAVPGTQRRPRLWGLAITGVVLLALVFAARALFTSHPQAAQSNSKLEQFWGPALASQQPVLICIANATDHSAEENLLLKSKSKVPALQSGNGSPDPLATDTNVNVTNEGLPLSPEIVPASDASVAFAMSGLFGTFAKPSQLRIGTAATYEDLRSFPAIVIGGFNSRWTMQLVSNLHYAFLRNNGEYMIREGGDGGRVWTTRLGPRGEQIEDFAIIARLVDSKTGQFTVTVAGIGPRGTQAAGEFVTSSRYLEEGLKGFPSGWQNRNLEVLLQTTVTDSTAGPPHVVATYSW